MFGRLHRIRKSIWAGYLLPIPACLLAWAGHLALFHAGATNTPFLPFLLAIVICSGAGGIGPGLLAIAVTEFLAGGFMMHHYTHDPLSIGNPIAAVVVVGVAIAAVFLTNFGTGAAIRLEQATKALRAVNETLEVTRQRAHRGPAPGRGKPAPGTENGSGRPAHRRHRA